MVNLITRRFFFKPVWIKVMLTSQRCCDGPFAAYRYRSLSFQISWNRNIITGANTFEYAEFKTEKFPVRRPTVLLQLTSYILSSLNPRQFFFIVQRHGLMTASDYVTQNEQFLLTSLPFNR
jgi:hypothetical protein